jgi:hypothetical protein
MWSVEEVRRKARSGGISP